MPAKPTSTYISRATKWLQAGILAVAMLLTPQNIQAQGKMFTIEKDSVPLFCGVAISFDIVEPALLMLSDKGGMEAALKVNLHNQYFPVFELGYGRADYTDEVTAMTYKTAAPYFRIGCDMNLLKKKHSGNRLYAGLRYAFTTFECDIERAPFNDPVWGWDTEFIANNEKCNQHWLEIVFGLDTKIVGPVRVGWMVRYKHRIAHKDTGAGPAWYVPGFGENGDTRIGANFNVIINI